MNPAWLSTETSDRQRQRASGDRSGSDVTAFNANSFVRCFDPDGSHLFKNGSTNGDDDRAARQSLNELLNLLNDTTDGFTRVGPRESSLRCVGPSSRPSEVRDPTSGTALRELIQLVSSTVKEFQNISDGSARETPEKLRIGSSRRECARLPTERHTSDVVGGTERGVARNREFETLMHPDVSCDKISSAEIARTLGSPGTVKPERRVPRFAEEIWGTEETFSSGRLPFTRSTELVEIYAGRARGIVTERGTPRHFSRESLDTTPVEWRTAEFKLPLRRNENTCGRSATSSASGSGIRSSHPVKLINFEDEIWPISARIPSGRDFAVEGVAMSGSNLARSPEVQVIPTRDEAENFAERKIDGNDAAPGRNLIRPLASGGEERFEDVFESPRSSVSREAKSSRENGEREEKRLLRKPSDSLERRKGGFLRDEKMLGFGDGGIATAEKDEHPLTRVHRHAGDRLPVRSTLFTGAVENGVKRPVVVDGQRSELASGTADAVKKTPNIEACRDKVFCTTGCRCSDVCVDGFPLRDRTNELDSAEGGRSRETRSSVDNRESSLNFHSSISTFDGALSSCGSTLRQCLSLLPTSSSSAGIIRAKPVDDSSKSNTAKESRRAVSSPMRSPRELLRKISRDIGDLSRNVESRSAFSNSKEQRSNRFSTPREDSRAIFIGASPRGEMIHRQVRSADQSSTFEANENSTAPKGCRAMIASEEKEEKPRRSSGVKVLARRGGLRGPKRTLPGRGVGKSRNEGLFQGRAVETKTQLRNNCVKSVGKSREAIARRLKGDPVVPDARDILVQAELKLTANRQLAERIRSRYPGSMWRRSLTSPETAGSLTAAVMRCGDYIESYGCGRDAIQKVNELLTSPALDLKEALENQRIALNTQEEYHAKRSVESCRKRGQSTSTAPMKRVVRQASKELQYQKQRIDTAILDIVELSKRFAPNMKEKENWRKMPSRIPNSTFSGKCATPRMNDSMNVKRIPAKRNEEIVETQMEITAMSSASNVSTKYLKNDSKSVASKIARTTTPRGGSALQTPRSSKDTATLKDRTAIAESGPDYRQQSVDVKKSTNSAWKRFAKPPVTASAVGNLKITRYPQQVKPQKNTVTGMTLPIWRPAGNGKIASTTSVSSSVAPKSTRPSSSLFSGKKKATWSTEATRPAEGRSCKQPSIENGTNGSRGDRVPETRQRVDYERPLTGDAKIVAKAGDRSTRPCRCFASEMKTQQQQWKKDPPNEESGRLTKNFEKASKSKVWNTLKNNQSVIAFQVKRKAEAFGKNSETNVAKPRSKSRPRPGTPNKISKTRVVDVPPRNVEIDLASKMSERSSTVVANVAKTKEHPAKWETMIASPGERLWADRAEEKKATVRVERREDLFEEAKSTERVVGTRRTQIPEDSGDRLEPEGREDTTPVSVALPSSENVNAVAGGKRTICETKGESKLDNFRDVDSDRAAKSGSESSTEDVAEKPTMKCVAKDSKTSSEETLNLNLTEVGYAAEFTSEESVRSWSASTKCCQVSLESSSSLSATSQEPSSLETVEVCARAEEISNSREFPKIKGSRETEEITEGDSAKAEAKAPKKKFSNRHTRSLHVLKEILSYQGLDLELLNRAERNAKLRHECRDTKRDARRSPMNSTLADAWKERGVRMGEDVLSKNRSSKTLVEKLATLTESESELEEAKSDSSGRLEAALHPEAQRSDSIPITEKGVADESVSIDFGKGISSGSVNTSKKETEATVVSQKSFETESDKLQSLAVEKESVDDNLELPTEEVRSVDRAILAVPTHRSLRDAASETERLDECREEAPPARREIGVEASRPDEFIRAVCTQTAKSCSQERATHATVILVDGETQSLESKVSAASLQETASRKYSASEENVEIGTTGSSGMVQACEEVVKIDKGTLHSSETSSMSTITANESSKELAYEETAMVRCLENRVPKDILIALQMATQRAQNLHTAIGIYKENLMAGCAREPEVRSGSATKRRREEAARNPTLSGDKGEKSVEGRCENSCKITCATRIDLKIEPGRDTGSSEGTLQSRSKTKQFPGENSERSTACGSSRTSRRFFPSKIPSKTPSKMSHESKKTSKKHCKSTATSCTSLKTREVLPEVEELLDHLLDRVEVDFLAESNSTNLEFHTRCSETLLDRRNTSGISKRSSEIPPSSIITKEYRTRSIVCRENLLPLIYTVVCSLVFCCLRFSFTCEV